MTMRGIQMVPKIKYNEEEKAGRRAGEGPAGGSNEN